MRAEQMARLLSSTDLSVTEVAQLAGWKDANHASRCFHAHYGIPPTEFRRQQAAQHRPPNGTGGNHATLDTTYEEARTHLRGVPGLGRGLP